MLGLLILALAAQAPDTGTADIVYYGGKLVRFLAKTETVVLLDSAWVKYRDMTVFSDSIHYDVKLHRLTAHGDVLFSSSDQNIDGTFLAYDIDTRKGFMRTARTEVENGFFFAREVWLVDERVLNARSGSYTTCDREHPHYAFTGPRVKLFMDDIAIAEPVVFRLFNVPLLAAPFWLVPVASRRKSGLMSFKVGNEQTQGWYAKNLAYYWVINDYADATFYCDVMSKKGIQPRLEAVYIVNPYARGSLQGSYIKEWDTGAQRYVLNASHTSKFFFGTNLSAMADLQSDASYAPEYGEETFDWLKPDIRSSAELTRGLFRAGSISALVSTRTEFSQHRRSAYLPRASLRFGTLRLPLRWNAAPSLSYENSLWTYSDSLDVDTSHTSRQQAGANLSLSSPQYSLGPAGDLSASAGLGLSDTRSRTDGVAAPVSDPLTTSLGTQLAQKVAGAVNLYEDLSFNRSDDLVDSVAAPPAYRAALSASMSLFKVIGIEAAGMHGVLHTARPGIGLGYQPKVESAGFFGRVRGLTPQVADVTFGLQNGFEAKVGAERTKFDLGRFDLSSSYDLVARHLAPLRANLGVQPLQALKNLNLRLDGSAGFDFDSLRLRDDYGLTTTLGWNQRFPLGRAPAPADSGSDSVVDARPAIDVRLSANHNLTKQNNMITGSCVLAVPGWNLTVSNFGYNFANRQITDYSLSLLKDLHCWEALVTFNRLGTRWKYDFEVRIKKLPDVKFGKSTFRPFLPE